MNHILHIFTVTFMYSKNHDKYLLKELTGNIFSDMETAC